MCSYMNKVTEHFKEYSSENRIIFASCISMQNLVKNL